MEDNTSVGAVAAEEDNILVNSTAENNNNEQEENIVAVSSKTVKEDVYQVSDLIKNCKALGYKKEVVTGALFNCEKTEMTKTEFETTIKNFLGKKVN